WHIVTMPQSSAGKLQQWLPGPVGPKHNTIGKADLMAKADWPDWRIFLPDNLNSHNLNSHDLDSHDLDSHDLNSRDLNSQRSFVTVSGCAHITPGWPRVRQMMGK